MKRYRVNVNGQNYLVEVEELEETSAKAAAGATGAAAQPAAQSVASPAATTSAASPAAASPGAAPSPAPPIGGSLKAEGLEVKAPLRGQIVRVAVNVGDMVQKGQVLLSIEALKLENEIVSPTAGTVTAVFVSPGKTVENGEVLLTIKEDESS
ncbi:MAG TPA: biotin/lipoyl-binding protein [Firmicutes bacterium]|nr:biotin/lipoyl-binding protein [Bacillota bacterium]